MGPDLLSVQRRKAALDQPLSFISFSINYMKSLAVDFINKQTEDLVRRNAFNVGIDAIKVVKGVRLSRRYNSIFGVIHPKAFVCVNGMSKVELYGCLEVIISDENKSDHVY